jgi:hypothetical protein
MKSIMLAVYGVRVKAAHTRRDFEVLDSFSEKGSDLFEVLCDILQARKAQVYRKQDTQQVLQVGKVNASKRHIEGLVQIGQYGSESEIRNLDHWTEVAYKKLVRDVDLQPFYFLFDIPEGKNLGLLLVQRTGVEGVQAVLDEALHESFVGDYPDHRLKMAQLVPDKLLRQLQSEDTKLTEIKFIRHDIARDITTVLGPAGTEQTAGTMELIVRPKQPVIARAFRQFVDRNRGTGSILELEETRFQYDNVKIKVEIDGKERTMDLADPKKIRATFDITADVKFSPTGHPTFKSISDVAMELLEDLKGELYGSGGNAP